MILHMCERGRRRRHGHYSHPRHECQRHQANFKKMAPPTIASHHITSLSAACRFFFVPVSLRGAVCGLGCGGATGGDRHTTRRRRGGRGRPCRRGPLVGRETDTAGVPRRCRALPAGRRARRGGAPAAIAIASASGICGAGLELRAGRGLFAAAARAPTPRQLGGKGG